TLVPVRAISEAFELTVDWDNATKTVNITGDGFSAKTPPEYLTDYGLSYSDDDAAITVYFAFRNIFSTAVKYNGTAKLTYKTADGTVIYQKDIAVNESMFKENEVGPYCEIVIPYSALKNGKREDGTIALDFSNAKDNKVYDQSIWAI
ncbi:MAG: hypothetical protein IK059_04590, partial [Firmicutes bacterium]|nr:hypothetical protein [Bacillota bacterium]